MKEPMVFNPAAWHWVIDGERRAWSSAAKAWITTWPADRMTRIKSIEELDEVMRRLGQLSPLVTVADVKAEARRRIVAKYPEWKQLNMMARSVELQDNRAQQAWSPAEKAEVEALKAAWVWIKSVRAASDKIEALDPIPMDYAADARWPL